MDAVPLPADLVQRFDGKAMGEVMSLGRMFLEPVWVFYRGAQTIDRLSQLKGKRIAIPSRFAVDFLFLRRMLAREGMTPERLDAILAQQTPDAEKRARANYVIDTGKGLEAARQQVTAVIADLRAKAG